MSCDPSQTSTNERAAESSRRIFDDSTSTMDVMSLNFVALELRETSNSSDNFPKKEIDEKIILSERNDKMIENKIGSMSNEERIRSRRKMKEMSESGNTAIAINENSQGLEIISLDELAWHDSTNDCWLAIYDYVYDCTEFLRSHPGGQDVILEYAGRDATIPFIGAGHSNDSRKILEKYLIGELPTNERLFRKIDGLKIIQL